MIVYYVHHHGSGHAHRAAAVAAACTTPVTGVSSRAAPRGWTGAWVRVPGDAAGADPDADDVTAGGTLHWAPRRHAGLRARTAALSRVLADPAVRLLVADVSVEAAVLARLHGVPVVLMAQPGERTDRPHRTAYDLAERVLAPWPEESGPAAPESGGTVHLGALSRFDARPPTAAPAPRRVLLLGGAGGSARAGAGVRDAAAATPDWSWETLGATTGDGPDPPNLRRLGWTDDPGDVWAALGRAEVVVTHAGQNALAEVAAARRPAVVVPERRPYDEQWATARALDAAGLAVVADGWPDPARWPGLLDRARRGGGDGWARWSDGRGAPRAAAVLDGLAA